MKSHTPISARSPEALFRESIVFPDFWAFACTFPEIFGPVMSSPYLVRTLVKMLAEESVSTGVSIL